jgi:hypothetical protein
VTLVFPALYDTLTPQAQSELRFSMAPQDNVTPNASILAEAAKAAAKGKGLPPVHLWNPPYCGEIDIVIKRDGTWLHEGTPIGRAPMVRLFSTILKREEGQYFLVTPVEKVGITVEDAPFVAMDAEVSGTGSAQSITFETNVGDRVTAGPDTPLRVARDPETGAPAPYVMVRAGLEALIDRKTFYRLVDIGQRFDIEGVSWFGLWSGGQFFPIIPASDLA